MALETLQNITEIDGFQVNQMGQLANEKYPVSVCHESNRLEFKIQDGPIKENGSNGCQVDQIIHVAHAIVKGLNGKFPCKDNENCLYHLEGAMQALRTRLFGS